jgi:outer membrane protein assembly factor BamB
MYRNFAFLAKKGNNGKIADLSLVDLMTGKDIWPDNNTPLEKALVGRVWDGLEYSFNSNEMFVSLFENDKKKALACFDILTGKIIWKSEKLKDYSPPTLYPFISSFNGKEADVYELDKRYGWTIKHYFLKNQTKPFSIVGMNELAMVIFDGQFSMFYYKSGTRGWTSRDALPKGANPLNSLLISNVFVSPVAEGNLVKLVGKDVFTGKVLWSKAIDRVYSFEKETIVATSKNEIILIDAKTGKDIGSKAFPAELATGYNIKDIKIQNSLVWLIMEKPNKGSLVYLFDKNLELLSQKDFEGKFIGKVFTGLGRIAMTLENNAKTTVESVVLRLARIKKN